MPEKETLQAWRVELARLKAQNADVLLLLCIGPDFYEAFGQDAETMADELDLELYEHPVLGTMLSLPAFAIDGYLRRLVQAGHKIAIAEAVVS